MAENQDVSTLSPDKLLNAFTKPRLAWCTGLATVIVVAVVAVLSIGDAVALMSGEPVDEETAEVEQVDPTAGEPVASDTAGEQAGDTQTASAGGNGETQPGTEDAAAEGEPDADNAYVQELRQAADPEEIPTESDLGISLEDTEF